MARRPLGCFSGPALAAVALTIFAIVGSARLSGGMLFSPGALSAQSTGAVLGNVGSHAEIGGQCDACHPAPWDSDTMADRCLACHTDVRGQFAQVGSRHAAYAKAQARLDCRPCHPEHGGASGPLTAVQTESFPHEAAGFALTGHREASPGVAFTCADCHDDDLLHFDASRCNECHARLDVAFVQRHEAAYGAACLACHDGVDTYGKAFDHNKLPFRLTGGHASLDCGECHAGARTPADLKAAKSDCWACHAKDDFHKGQLGTDCGRCHSSEAWKPAAFDHNQSSFPLTGAHSGVRCEDCHATQFSGTPAQCAACHAPDDAHKGQFGSECGSCHSTTAWQPATFDHNRSSFPLTGAHVGLPCRQCHATGFDAKLPTACEGCHREPSYHAGLFPTGCQDCHSAASWKPARFDRPHQFPFDHGRASGCDSCHPSDLNTWTCTSCHSAAEMADEHRGKAGYNDNCIECHPTGDEGDGGGGGDRRDRGDRHDD